MVFKRLPVEFLFFALKNNGGYSTGATMAVPRTKFPSLAF